VPELEHEQRLLVLDVGLGLVLPQHVGEVKQALGGGHLFGLHVFRAELVIVRGL